MIVSGRENLGIEMASFTVPKSGSYFDTPQPDGRKRLYEVHFPHNYVQYHPQGITPPADTSLVLPVSVVCHATHKEQASQIVLHREVGGYYRFTPHEKSGKSYVEDGRPLGESYRCAQDGVPDAHTPCYQSIPDTEQVFPGYYSWWGLASPGLTPDQQTSLSWITSSPPAYLKKPPKSVYGGYAFESKFSDLLQSYASSQDCAVEDIYLKVGGTLRYKCEIAYVVIVCTSHDLGALNSYHPITHAPPDVFKHNGLVGDDGKVINIARVPNFTTRYVDSFSSYETLSFAFYFSSPLADFRCPSSTVERYSIDHQSFCIRTKPMVTWFDPDSGEFNTKWSCPDDEKAQKTHANVTGFAMQFHDVSFEVTAVGTAI